MKNFLKKLSSITLAMIMLSCSFLVGDKDNILFEIGASAADSTSQGIYNRLLTIKSVYPAGSYFTVDGGICTSDSDDNCKLSNIPARGVLSTGAAAAQVCGEGWSCCGFARYVFYNTFYHSPTANTTEVSIDNAKPGDFVVFSGHYGIFLYADTSSVYVYDSNFTTTPTNRVQWETKITRSRVSTIYHSNAYASYNSQYGGSSSSVVIPQSVKDGVFNQRKVVAVAPKRINFDDGGYIAQGDVCILYNVDASTGYCKVDYPSGSSNVFGASNVKTQIVAINDFINYDGVTKSQVPKIQRDVTTYTTADMTAGLDVLKSGRDYITISKFGDSTLVMFYANEAHIYANYWVLGYAPIQYHYLDLNGLVDGVQTKNIGGYGICDIYVNGSIRGDNVADYYDKHPEGSLYEIKNIGTNAAYVHKGFAAGAASGRIVGYTDIRLKYDKKPATVSSIAVTKKPTKLEYIQGEVFDSTGLVVTATYSDGTTKDVTSLCTLSGFDSTASGTKNIVVTYSSKTTSFTVVVQDYVCTFPGFKVPEDAKIDFEEKIIYMDSSPATGTGTGATLEAQDNIGNTIEFQVVVYGDVTGDGVTDVLDASQIALASSNKKEFEGVVASAADLNCDGAVNELDYQLSVNKMI